RAYAAEAGLDPDETVDDFVRQFPHDSVIAGHVASVHVDDSEQKSKRRPVRVVARLIGISVPVAALVLYFGIANRRAPSVEAERVPAPAAVSESLAGGVDVEVTALRGCLLTAGVDGQPLVDTRLEAGGRQSFNAQTELTLPVSDPPAIKLLINVGPGPPLGP